jgi:hypothetical protein
MEIYQDLSKFKTLDELQDKLIDESFLEKSNSFLCSKCTNISLTDTRIFLSSYCLVLFPDAFFTTLTQINLANAAAELIENTNDNTFTQFKSLFYIWKTNNLNSIIEDIDIHLNEIPQSDEDDRFENGFLLQKKILTIAHNYFNSLKNKTMNAQQSNPT